MAREYQHVLELLPQIKGMLESGMTQSEVAAKLGLSGKKKIHNLLTRERKKALQGVPKQRGRNSTVTKAFNIHPQHISS